MQGSNKNLIISTQRENRVSEDIIYSLINTAGSGVRKTELMCPCNISFRQLKHYLYGCLETNLIKRIETSSKKRTSDKNYLYAQTRKGKIFGGSIYKLQDLLLSTGVEEDPYNDSKLAKEIEAAISSLCLINESIKKLKPTIVDVFTVERRNKNSIIEDILDVITEYEPKKKSRVTKIMYKADLSHRQVKDYLSRLKNINLIKDGRRGLERIIYEKTRKGEFFRQNRKVMNWMLNTGEYPFNDDGLVAEIEAAYSPMLSVKIPQDAFVVPHEQLLQ